MAQSYGTDLSLTEQLTLVFILIITSKGMAGVPGTLIVVCGGNAFVIGINRLLDMVRTTTRMR
ncbi:cation:dicarboxylate symporter family transporter [Siminovitchia terrae]|uniref:cation:dicarboxylate symporter family transporter n=1 Tax=Siminovitchia terrae TaxID=1914933 RepID=UPI0028A65A52|nr:cation:dicarboxylase symporter family transporter [Siminovitchia terrae]